MVDFGNALQRLSASMGGANNLANYDAQNLQNQQAQMDLQQNQSALAMFADPQNQNIDPIAAIRKLALINPGKYLGPAATIQAQLAEAKLKNPMSSAILDWQNGQQGGGQPGQPTGTPQKDPNALAPESPDDKRNYDFLNSQVPPQYRSLIRQISNGDESVGNADSLRSNGLLTLAAQFDPSLNKTDFTVRQATAKDMAPGGKSGQAVTSANTAVKHLAQVALAGLDLHNGNNQLWNKISNIASAAVGNDPTTNLESVVQTVAPELAKAASGGGETTEADRRNQADSFGISQSPEQLLGAVAGKADLINSKMEEVGNTYKLASGGRTRQTLSSDNKAILDNLKQLHQYAKDDKLDDPKAQAIVKQLRGVIGDTKAQPSTIPEGQTATNPQTGQKLIFKGGKWSPA